MPPHCDAMDGPVVKAAIRVLSSADVSLVLPFVHKESESEVVRAFEKVIRARKEGAIAREVADLYFFETVVRIHRAGEGAPFSGLKPAGLSEGPVIPAAEAAIEAGTPDLLLELLTEAVESEVRNKFHHVMALKGQVDGGVDEAREYFEAMLGFVVYANALYECTKGGRAAHVAQVD